MSQTLPNPSERQRLETLNSIARDEIGYRRSREQHIFAWSSAILVGLITSLLVVDIKSDSLLGTWWGKIMATGLILFASCVSAAWQMKQKILLAEVQRVSSGAMSRMGLLNLKRVDGQPITHKKWETWGKKPHSWERHLSLRNPGKILTTCLLGLAAVITLWATLLNSC